MRKELAEAAATSVLTCDLGRFSEPLQVRAVRKIHVR